MLTDGNQHCNHGQLKQINHSGTDPACGFDAEGHRQRLEAKFSVSFNTFEVIHNSNPQASKAVGERQDCSAPGQLTEQGLTSPPGKCDVTGPQGVISQPTVLFELQGWS